MKKLCLAVAILLSAGSNGSLLASPTGTFENPFLTTSLQNETDSIAAHGKKQKKERKEDRKEARKNTREHLKSEIEDQKQDAKENLQDSKDALKEGFNHVKENVGTWFNENIKANTVGDYDEIQRQNNQQFADYLREGWLPYPIALRERTELLEGSFFTDRQKNSVQKADTNKRLLTIAKEAFFEPLPVLKAPVPETYFDGAGTEAVSRLLTKQFISVKFYGQELKLYYNSSLKATSLGKGREKDVAKFWQYLSEQDFNSVLFQLFQHKEQLGLNDFQYYQLVSLFSEQLFIKGKQGEAQAFTVFILNQTGYDARMAKLQTEKESKMVILLPIFEEITDMPYITIGKNDYYLSQIILAKKDLTATLRTYEKAFATATHPISIRIDPNRMKIPPLYGKFQGYTFNERLAEMEAAIPNGPLPLYAAAPFNELIHKTFSFKLKSELDSLVQKKQDANLKETLSEREKQEIKILNLNYFLNRNLSSQSKKSAKLTGRYLYPDLMFFKRGAGDILDRSLLLCQIASRILDIPAVLLIYPNFAMAAVCLDQNGESPADSPFTQSDCIEIEGKKYFLCGNLPKNVEAREKPLVFKW